jgi:hypothetical protein
MFKKSLFIIALVLMLIIGFSAVATAQVPDTQGKLADIFRVYNFADLNFFIQAGMYLGEDWKDNAFYPDDAYPFAVNIKFNDGYNNWTGVLAFYFRLDAPGVWEGDDGQYFDYYGRLRINFQDDASEGFRLDYSEATWGINDTTSLTIGNTRYSSFYGTAKRTNYMQMAMAMDMMTFVFELRAIGDQGDGIYDDGIIDFALLYSEPDYPTGMGLLVDGDGYFEVLLGLWGIDLETIYIDVTAIYGFINTLQWDSAAEYGGGRTKREKGGYIWGDIYAGITLEDIMEIGFNDTLYVGLTQGIFKNEVILSLDVTAVENLTVALSAMFGFETYSEVEVDGYLLPSMEDAEGIGMYIVLPVDLEIGYTLDMGGMSVYPYLYGNVDLGGMIMGVDQDIDYDKRPWDLKVGANITLAGGNVLIPICFEVTNFGYMSYDTTPNPGTMEFYAMYYYGGTHTYNILLFGGDPQAYIAKLYILIGIQFDLQ